MVKKKVVVFFFVLVFMIAVVGARNALDGPAVDRYSAERGKIMFNDQDNNVSPYTLIANDFRYGNGSSCCGAGGGGINYWGRSGTDVYPAALRDFVGINTNEPTHNLHVNGSVNITGTAYIHALEGNSPIMVKSDLVLVGGKNVSATYYVGSGKFLTDINASNASFADVAASTTCAGNELLLGNGSCVPVDTLSSLWNFVNGQALLIDNRSANVSTDFDVGNDTESGSFTLNDETITDWSQVGVRIYEENVTVVVSGGSGSGITSFCCTDAEILQVAVFPITSTNRYYFEANVTGTGVAVDTDRVGHQGDWIVAHRGSVVTSDTISYYIMGVLIDESFRVRVRYRQ